MAEYFEMKMRNNDVELITKIVNQGIDSRLEGFTQSRFYPSDIIRYVDCNIHPAEMQILIRRLLELETEEAEMLADDIVRIYYDEEII